jgi:hypothetical protein
MTINEDKFQVIFIDYRELHLQEYTLTACRKHHLYWKTGQRKATSTQVKEAERINRDTEEKLSGYTEVPCISIQETNW